MRRRRVPSSRGQARPLAREPPSPLQLEGPDRPGHSVPDGAGAPSLPVRLAADDSESGVTVTALLALIWCLQGRRAIWHCRDCAQWRPQQYGCSAEIVLRGRTGAAQGPDGCSAECVLRGWTCSRTVGGVRILYGGLPSSAVIRCCRESLQAYDGAQRPTTSVPTRCDCSGGSRACGDFTPAAIQAVPARHRSCSAASVRLHLHVACRGSIRPVAAASSCS